MAFHVVSLGTGSAKCVLPMAVVGAGAAAGTGTMFGSPSSVISEIGRQGTFSGMAFLSDHTWTRSSVRTAPINPCTRNLEVVDMYEHGRLRMRCIAERSRCENG